MVRGTIGRQREILRAAETEAGAATSAAQAPAGSPGGNRHGRTSGQDERRKTQQARITPQFDKVAVIGHALWLMTQSAAHKYLSFDDMNWMLTPPVALGQYRLWHQGRMPVAFASWAFLNEDAEARIRQDFRALGQDDWDSGTQAWLIDVVAPFGGLDEAVVDLKEKMFPGRTLKALRPAPGGKGTTVVEW